MGPGGETEIGSGKHIFETIKKYYGANLLDGNSGISRHVWSELGNWVYLGYDKDRE